MSIEKLIENISLEKGLDLNNLLFKAIFMQSPVGISVFHNPYPTKDIRNDIMINSRYEEITGRTREELIKLGWVGITHSDDIEKNMVHYEKMISGEIERYSMEKRFIKPDGSVVWVHMLVSRLYLTEDGKYSHITLIEDITQKKQVEIALLESERSKSVYLSQIPGLAYRCLNDEYWTMEYVSEGCYGLTGYKSEDLLYNNKLSYFDIIVPEYIQSIKDEWNETLSQKGSFKFEYEIITSTGKKKWVLEMGQGVFNEKDEVVGLEGIVIDISDRKRVENDLTYNNEHDSLTGLYNRNYLIKMLNTKLRENKCKNRAIMVINISDIYSLNITYGFVYCQDLIKMVANLLYLNSNSNRVLFKTYENRFLFYIDDYKDKYELIDFYRNVVSSLESILTIERVGGGIGIYEIKEDSNLFINDYLIDQILKKGLIASERALHVSDHDFGICFYDKEMEERLFHKESIEHKLMEIASGKNIDDLYLLFQPILECNSNKICGFEALARIKCSKLGLVPPMDFIPIAEKTKYIIELGDLIFRKAFDFQNKLKSMGFDKIYISINVSVIQLLRDGFVENLMEIIDESKINPNYIQIEITESIFASNYDKVNKILSIIRTLGIKIAIDDFGIGYSSLGRGIGLNVDCLKIDKSFIDNILLDNGKRDTTIVKEMISIGHKLGYGLIAEGVEREEQKKHLLDNGCDKLQGYLLSVPLDEKSAIDFIKNR